jgi:ribosome-associated heat shock protein Hsp15
MDAQRLDKFLFQARFFKTRALAAKLVADGRVRLDGKPVAKAHQPVKPGDVLTFPQGNAIRVVRGPRCRCAAAQPRKRAAATRTCRRPRRRAIPPPPHS